ncbi:homoserine O-acetyltransferase MetX [Dermacoccaceae bacterium W4C1]
MTLIDHHRPRRRTSSADDPRTWARLPEGTNPDAFGLRIGSVALENGRLLPDVVVAVQTWGRLDADGANAILIEHALTGDTHVLGEAGVGQPTPGWWDGVVGPGRAIDTDRWFVVATNTLGGCRGTTGPGSLAPDGRPWGSRFPQISIRDMVTVEAAVADLLGIECWRLVVGGSMGGMRALEWAGGQPDRAQSVAVIASCAAASADQIAWGQAQALAITMDPEYAGGDYYLSDRRPEAGLGLARRIAHTTYRSSEELGQRFGAQAQPGESPLEGGRFAVESYLDHHAGKLVGRFDAGSYLALTRAMATHDVGRGRGGLTSTLTRFRGDLLVAGVDSDRLFPLQQSHELAAAAGQSEAAVIHSSYGHDGFLIESQQVGDLLRAHLEPSPSRRHP